MPTTTLPQTSIPAGQLITTKPFKIAGFPSRYALTIYVPPGYDDGNRYYPVAYMFDGQNLFGDDGSYAGGWHLHEALDKLAAKGKVVPLVVGIHNGGLSRIADFSPWPIDENAARGEAFLTWMVSTLMPKISKEWRVLQGPENTMIGGSSLGGLMAIYGFFRFAGVFGKVLSMSPSVWVGNRELLRYVEALPLPDERLVYVDAGGREERTMLGGLALAAALAQKGLIRGEDLMWRPEVKGAHNERSWRRRLPKALRFLYGQKAPRRP